MHELTAAQHGPRAQPIFSDATNAVYCFGGDVTSAPPVTNCSWKTRPLARITRAKTVPLLPLESSAPVIRASRAGKPWNLSCLESFSVPPTLDAAPWTAPSRSPRTPLGTFRTLIE